MDLTNDREHARLFIYTHRRQMADVTDFYANAIIIGVNPEELEGRTPRFLDGGRGVAGGSWTGREILL